MIEGVVLQLLMEKEVGVRFSGPLEKYVYKDTSIHCFDNKNC